MRASLGVVIPALDEERDIEAAVADARRAGDEVVVADGGSRDRTVARALRAGARVVDSPPGRGVQLNCGAAALGTDLLLFLHADTRLPADAGARIRQAIDTGHAGGGFLVRWNSPRPIYRLGERIINARTRWTRSPLGDQALFCTRSVFDRLGGFRDWPILEDLDFVRRLRRVAPVAVVDVPVTTSTRRFDRGGIAHTIVLNWLIFGLYFAGVSPRRLATLYRRR